MSAGEIYDKANLSLLQELKEDRRIERKPVNFGAEALGLYFSMWANTPLEIESPGGFPPLVTPENIYYTEHPRNPFLFDAMFYLKFVRAAREGARRIRDSMQAWELPKPEFSEKERDTLMFV